MQKMSTGSDDKMSYTVSDLVIYPVKSLGGIHLQNSRVEAEGLQHDRRWMLVDEQGMFLTQREHPAMCLFTLQLQEHGFLIEHAHKRSSFFLPFDQQSGEQIPVTVWDDHVYAVVVSADADAWFSGMMEKKCRLVKLTSQTQRKVDPRYAFQQEVTGFADGFPLLVIGEASLNELNNRLNEPVPMNRFRPNLVFKGGAAFDEDGWSILSAGTVQLRIVKPCARCVITTIDQHTAVASKEPLRTLSAYRTKENKVLFGQNSLVVNPGMIHIGDEVTF